MNSHDINHGPEIISVRSPPGQRPWMLLGQGRFLHSKSSLKTKPASYHRDHFRNHHLWRERREKPQKGTYRTSYLSFCVLLYFFVAIPSPLQLLYLCSPYADRPAKMCGVRQLCGYLPDGGDFHRFAEEPGVCQCGRMRRML